MPDVAELPERDTRGAEPLLTSSMHGRFVSLQPLLPEADLVDGLWEAVTAGRALRGPFSAEDGGLFKYFSHVVRTREDLDRFVSDAVSDAAAVPMVIKDAATQRIIGSTRFVDISLRNRKASIGWTFLARPYQRDVFHSEAMLLMLGAAFEKHGLGRVGFKVDALNTQGRAALARMGAVEEGVLRAHEVCFPEGRLRNTVILSVLADEWALDVKPRLVEAVERAAAARLDAEAVLRESLGVPPEPSVARPLPAGAVVTPHHDVL